MTPEERDKLIDNYAWRVVDDMDIKDLCRIVADKLPMTLKLKAMSMSSNKLKSIT